MSDDAYTREMVEIYAPGLFAKLDAAEDRSMAAVKLMNVWADRALAAEEALANPPVWVEPIETPTKPPYGTPERAAYDACDGCSEPNRCGCPRAARLKSDVQGSAKLPENSVPPLSTSISGAAQEQEKQQ